MDTTEIFTQHRSALERLATKITGEEEDARDVVADAFAALLDGGPADPEHAVQWLYVTVRHRAYNRVRGRARAQRRLHKLAVDTGTPLGPESALRSDGRIRTLLSGAAAHLSERDRIAVSLRHLQEASYDDVAAALGTTPSQARVVVHRATSRLRGHLMTSLARRHGEGDPRIGDEVAALLQAPVAVPLAQRARIAVREWWRRTQSVTGRTVAYVGEVVAPAVAFAAMAAGPVSAAVVDSSPASVPAVATLPAPPAASASPAASTVRTAAPPDHAADGPSRVALKSPVLDAAIGSPLQRDDTEPPPPLTPPSVREQRRSLLRTLGLGLDVPDPLDAAQGPQADIRSVEVATLAGEDGLPSALRWRVGFAEPPPTSLSVAFSWKYAGTTCSSSWWGGSQGTTSCAQPLVLLVNESKEMGRFPVEVHRDGLVVEAVVRFASLDDFTRARLRPGAELVEIVAGASCNLLDPSGCGSGDRAPDNGYGWSYRVEE